MKNANITQRKRLIEFKKYHKTQQRRTNSGKIKGDFIGLILKKL